MVLAVVPPVWGTLKKPLVDCVVQLDAVVEKRFPRTRERLHVIAAAAAAESVQANGAISVRALPLNLGRVLSRGLFDGTEAMLDSLLPHMDSICSDSAVKASKKGSPKSGSAAARRQRKQDEAADDTDSGDDDEGEESAEKPGRNRPQRTLPFYRAFALQLSNGTHTLRVNVLYVQDTYTSLAQRLGVDRLWQLVRSLHAREVKRELVDAARDPPAAAVKAISYFGCEKFVGETLVRFLSSRLVAKILGAKGASWAAAAAWSTNAERRCASPASPEECPGLEIHPAKPSSEGRRRLGAVGPEEVAANQLQLSQLEQDAALAMGLRVVVKNSFIELVPESQQPPPGFRRTQSCDPAFLRANMRAHQHSLSPPPRECPSGLHEALMAAPPPPVHEAPGKTTLMIRNLPLDLSREQLLAELDLLGLSGVYNFVYLPIDFTRRRGLGYALVSAESQEASELMLERLSGHEPSWPRRPSRLATAAWLAEEAPSSLAVAAEGPEDPADTVWQASWSEPCRTLEEHIDRYRNSPVMHPSIPDEYKPLIFAAGVRVPFPPPTRPIRPPRIRHMKSPMERS